MKDILFFIYIIMPFIMVAYLLITTIFTGSFSGVLVLTGLLIATIIVITVSSFISDNLQESVNPLGKLLSFNNSTLSKLPLGTSTFAFMFAYFTTVIVKNDIVSSNLFLITTLTVILVGDIVFQRTSGGMGDYAIVPALIGGFVGLIWASILPKSSQMIPSSLEQSKCDTKKGIYRCRIRKTGEIVSTNK